MVTVYTTTDPKQVALMEMVLRDAELEFRVDNENAGLVTGLPTSAIPIQFQVREQDAAAAREAIREALAKIKS
jgi:hypothetical protein